LDPHLAYVSGDAGRDLPYARCYEVREVLPYKEKHLRAALRAHDVGPLTIKKRGVDVSPEVLRKRLGLRGDRPATLILSRTPGSAVALLVDPLVG
ncbi:MAG: THUMP-like domain-containing protein, partial [Nocardioidaceae bacterium]